MDLEKDLTGRPKLGVFLAIGWTLFWGLLRLAVIFAVMFPVHFFLAIAGNIMKAIPSVYWRSRYACLHYGMVNNEITEGWNFDLELSVLGGGVRIHTMERIGLFQVVLGWRWLVRIAFGGNAKHKMVLSGSEHPRHRYISLGLLGYHLDLGSYGGKRRARLFLNERRLFYP